MRIQYIFKEFIPRYKTDVELSQYTVLQSFRHSLYIKNKKISHKYFLIQLKKVSLRSEIDHYTIIPNSTK